MNELHLFAGAGGGILAGQLLGHRCVCAVEREPYAKAVLVARQNDGTFPPFPIWDDVSTFDGRPWRGVVDVVAGGFPCQDISVAGAGAGLDGERSGLWSEFARIIGEVRPRFAFIENSPMLTVRGLDRVLCDLAALGFDARWGVISAADCGAPHLRERVWILAHASELQRDGFNDNSGIGVEGKPLSKYGDGCGSKDVAKATSIGQQGQRESINSSHFTKNQERQAGDAFDVRQSRKWPAEPELGRVANGVAHRPHRLKAIGNGQVPRVAATAFKILTAR